MVITAEDPMGDTDMLPAAEVVSGTDSVSHSAAAVDGVLKRR